VSGSRVVKFTAKGEQELYRMFRIQPKLKPSGLP